MVNLFAKQNKKLSTFDFQLFEISQLNKKENIEK